MNGRNGKEIFFLNFVLCVRMLCGAVGSQKLRDGQLSALLERAQRKFFLSLFSKGKHKNEKCVSAETLPLEGFSPRRRHSLTYTHTSIPRW